MKPSKPVLLALLLAEHVYTDAGSNKKVIAGTFNTLHGTEFPSRFQNSTYVFVCMTELVRPVDVQLRFVRVDTGEVLLQTHPIPVRESDPLRTVEIALQVPPLPMPEAGIYAFEVLIDDELFAQRRIEAVKKPAKD